MSTIGETIDAWALPPDTSQRLKDWLTSPAQGWTLAASPDEAFFTLTEDDLKAAGFHILRERKLILAKLKPPPGAPLEGGKGSLEGVSPRMMRFAKWAAQAGDENEADDWLELPEGVFFLGLPDLGSRLYVRDAYRKLADVLEQLRAKGKAHGVISGNPGLGKTWFAIWMLVRWLRKGIDVLWQSPTSDFFYFKDGAVQKLLEAEADYVLRSEEELRYIVDGAKPRLAMVVKQSFVVHSPDSSQYKEYLKLGAASNSPHYMPHWTYDELNTVRLELHPGVTDQQMKQLIARRGAVPRYVLTEGPWEEMDTWIEDAVTDLKWEDIVSAIPGSARASHRIAAIHPTRWQEGNFFSYELQFLSVAVRDAVAKRLLETIAGGLAQLMILVNKSARGLAADLGSCVEESIVHAVLKEGGLWVIRECPPQYNRGPLATGKFAEKHAGSGTSTASTQKALVPSKEKASAGSSSLQSAPSSGGEEEKVTYSASSQSDGQEGSLDPVVASNSPDRSEPSIGSISRSTSGSSSPSDERRLNLKKLPVFYFTHAKELENLPDDDVYLQPTAPNYPAIDAIAICGSKAYLFQVTRSGSHTIDKKLCNVLAYLPAHLEVEWIWVLPPEIWADSSFNVRKVPNFDGTGFSAAKVRLIEDRLQAVQTQYKMAVLELSKMQQAPEQYADEPEAGEAQVSAKTGATKTTAVKQQQGMRMSATSTGKAGKQRRKGNMGTASALLMQSSVDCRIVRSRAQSSFRDPACMPALPQRLHPKAGALPPSRLLSASFGLQRFLS